MKNEDYQVYVNEREREVDLLELMRLNNEEIVYHHEILINNLKSLMYLFSCLMLILYHLKRIRILIYLNEEKEEEEN
jgi:hypothetical protein